jgi:hypothetical protein
MSTASGNSFYVNKGLTYRSTDQLIKEVELLNLSSSSVFAVDIKAEGKPFATKNLEKINFFAYEAVLPGRSFQTSEVINNIQGVTERYPTATTYPEVDVSFYVGRDYEILNFFQGWMDYISPTQDNTKPDGFIKFNYPDSYECYINIVKYERDLRQKGSRLTTKGDAGVIRDPSTYTHTLINAYPINIISVPLSYNQSDILRTTITFNYDRYVVQNNRTALDFSNPRDNASRQSSRGTSGGNLPVIGDVGGQPFPLGPGIPGLTGDQNPNVA